MQRIMYTGKVYDKTGRCIFTSRPRLARTDAIRDCFAHRPSAKKCSTGYGAGGHFAIEWHNREDMEAR